MLSLQFKLGGFKKKHFTVNLTYSIYQKGFKLMRSSLVISCSKIINLINAANVKHTGIHMISRTDFRKQLTSKTEFFVNYYQ